MGKTIVLSDIERGWNTVIEYSSHDKYEDAVVLRIYIEEASKDNSWVLVLDKNQFAELCEFFN